MKLGLFADIAILLAGIASTLGFFGGLVMVIVRPWRRRGRKVLLWSVGVFIAATVIITGNADRDAREAGFVDAADKRLATETGFTDPGVWSEHKAQEAKRTKKAEQEYTASIRPKSKPSPNKSLLQHLQDSEDTQKPPEPKIASRTTADPPAPTLQQPVRVTETHYIKGNRVALRAGPGKKHKVLGRLNTGRELEFLGEQSGKWSRYRDKLTRREGWVASYLAVPTNPANKPQRRANTPSIAKTQPAKRRLSRSAIIRAIIREDHAGYSGSCPCPENRDRGGRRCGKRSAYSRPGGASPLCYAHDVTAAMIEDYRRRH